MYKVSEVAQMLSVEKVKIFEVLIVHDSELAPYITKKRHLSYINDTGVRFIEKILFNDTEEFIEEDIKLEDIENETDSNLLIIRNCQKKRDELKKEVVDLKRELNILDRDMRYKLDAITNYQEIINEDIKWLIGLENKINNFKIETQKDNSKKSFLTKFIK